MKKKVPLRRPEKMSGKTVAEHCRAILNHSSFRAIEGLWANDRIKLLDEIKKTLDRDKCAEFRGYDRPIELIYTWSEKYLDDEPAYELPATGE